MTLPPNRRLKGYCKKCSRHLPDSAFNKKKTGIGGLYNCCRECQSKYNREYHYRWYRNCGKEIVKKNVKVYRKKKPMWDMFRPEQRMAYAQFQNAKRRGLIKPMPCEVCGSKIRVEAHHHDYSKPLDVKWFCHQHHKQEHGITSYSDKEKFDV